VPVAAEEPFVDLEYEAALKAAERDEKIVLIDYYTTWCGPCKKLDRTTWKDEKVRAWLEKHTVALKIDAEKQRDLAKKHRVRAYPTILLLRPDETVVDRLVGYRGAATFLEEVKAALAGKDSLARAREKLDGSGEKDPMERMNYARELHQRGKHAEALEHYLWCFDHGESHSRGFTGVRLSFLASDIQRLGAEYEPAIKALKARRDAARRIVLAKRDAKKTSRDDDYGLFGRLAEKFSFPGVDAGRARAAMELAALNRTLEANEDTLNVYEALVKQEDVEPLTLKMLVNEIVDLLLDRRRYADIQEGLGDLLEEVERRLDMLTHDRKMVESGQLPEDVMVQFRRSTIEECAKYYEVALGVGDQRLAERIARKLIDVDQAEYTFTILVQHAIRAGDMVAAKQLHDRSIAMTHEGKGASAANKEVVMAEDDADS